MPRAYVLDLRAQNGAWVSGLCNQLFLVLNALAALSEHDTLDVRGFCSNMFSGARGGLHAILDVPRTCARLAARGGPRIVDAPAARAAPLRPAMFPLAGAHLLPCLAGSSDMMRLARERCPAGPFTALHVKLDVDSAIFYGLGENHVALRQLTALGNRLPAYQAFVEARLPRCRAWLEATLQAYLDRVAAHGTEHHYYICTSVTKSPHQRAMEPTLRRLLAALPRHTVAPATGQGREIDAWVDLMVACRADHYLCLETVGSTFSHTVQIMREKKCTF